MASVTIKRNDTARALEDILTLDSLPIDLTGASLYLVMRHKDSREVIRKAATIVAPLTGSVKYDFVAADVDMDGVFEQEWEITFPGGKVITVPDNGYNTITIVSDLG